MKLETDEKTKVKKVVNDKKTVVVVDIEEEEEIKETGEKIALICLVEHSSPVNCCLL